MVTFRLTQGRGAPAVLAVPVRTPTDVDRAATATPTVVPLDPGLLAEVEAFLADREHTGRAGLVHVLPRPLRTPATLFLVGVGGGEEGDWRTAGAAIVRAARRETALTIALPADAGPVAVRGLAEGGLLAGYRSRLGVPDEDAARLAEVTVAVAEPAAYQPALDAATTVAEVTVLARDLVNTPSGTKTPAWFVAQIDSAAAKRDGLSVTVREPAALAAEGFAALLAVGGGSARGPRLLEVTWQPPAADPDTPHVVLVGKGITFDTGGIDIKPRDAMKLMRKDMAGAAAVTAATLGAAALGLPVRVTALAPLAENAVSGSAYRPGDVIRHYNGLTSEIYNTDAEGRVVLADALGYAVRHLAPDLLVDLATLTGAASIALGKRTAALYSENDQLAGALADAATAAGERVWRMPLPEDYVYGLEADVADLSNSPDIGAGSILAALYLREFTGDRRSSWAHLDMSAPAWADSVDGELAKGATGWGVRTLLRWLDRISLARAALSPRGPISSSG